MPAFVNSRFGESGNERTRRNNDVLLRLEEVEEVLPDLVAGADWHAVHDEIEREDYPKPAMQGELEVFTLRRRREPIASAPKDFMNVAIETINLTRDFGNSAPSMN